MTLYAICSSFGIALRQVRRTNFDLCYEITKIFDILTLNKSLFFHSNLHSLFTHGLNTKHKKTDMRYRNTSNCKTEEIGVWKRSSNIEISESYTQQNGLVGCYISLSH